MRPRVFLSAALLCRQTTALSIPQADIFVKPGDNDVNAAGSSVEEKRDLSGLLSGALDILDAVPGIVNQAINTTIQVVRALKETVDENGLLRDDLTTILGLNTTTGMPLMNNSTAKAVTCPDVAIVFARGTNEPGKPRVVPARSTETWKQEHLHNMPGNVGFLTGPPFFDALRTYMNGTSTVAVQGVNNYPAIAAGFFAGGSPNGAAFMTRVAQQTISMCPNTKLTMSGYSQGSQVARLAIAAMPADAQAKISSVVLFGDPLGGKAIQGVDSTRLLVVCHTGDNICQGGQFIFDPHLNYSLDAPTAALFVMQRSRLGIASGDARNEGMGNTMVGKVQDIMCTPKQ
ncbi:hypothetical protein COL922a_006109 [Colletotrichum nupharicola]|nr:hypothetical protein COL922a_006109 [Colletotrichum nupharicola]